MGCDNTADTNAAMDELKLKPGQQAYTLIKGIRRADCSN
jgi:molybdopterin-binding protein